MLTTFKFDASGSEYLIPLCVPEIRGNEGKYIQECLDTNYVSSVGSYVDRFERAIADYVGTKYAVATVNGTAALHIALLVAGIKKDDEVLVSTLSFVAPANAIRYAGGWPVFVDAEPDYWQMDPDKIEDFIQQKCHWVNGELRNRSTGRRVSAIMPVHILGHPVDIDPIICIARKYGLIVIEDAAESLGANYKNRMVGSLADIACFSFNGNKIITTGGGGMIVTGNEEWARRAKYLTTQAKDDPIEFVHGEVGYNYRLTNIQAAMGCAQMEMLEEYVSIKRQIASRYAAMLAGVKGITLMREAKWAYSTYWLFTVLIDKSKYGIDSRTVMQRLANNKIQTRPLWQPLHLSDAHANDASVICAVAERLNKEALSLPCSTGLKDDQIEVVVETLKKIVD